MKYLLIGTLLGSLVSSEHENREACEGRAVILREKGASVQCVQAPGGFSTNIILCSTSNCNSTVPVQR